MVSPPSRRIGRSARGPTRLIAALVLLAACSSPPAEQAPEYVGMSVDSLSAPVVVVAAGTLEKEGVDTLYSIWHVRTTDGAEMIWLQRARGRSAAGRLNWEIRAVLPLPSLQPGEHVSFHTCELESRPDQSVVALLGEEEWKEVFTNVRFAWRADPAGERFERVEPSRVRCLNEGWGV